MSGRAVAAVAMIGSTQGQEATTAQQCDEVRKDGWVCSVAASKATASKSQRRALVLTSVWGKRGQEVVESRER